MRKLLLFLLFLPILLKAQNQPYYTVYNYGNAWQRGIFGTTLTIPFHDTTLGSDSIRAGAILLRPSDGLLYIWNGTSWGTILGNSNNVLKIDQFSNLLSSNPVYDLSLKTYFPDTVRFISGTQINVYGDSYTANTGLVPSDSIWINRIAFQFGAITINSYATSGRGYYNLIAQLYANGPNFRSTKFIMSLTGLNDYTATSNGVAFDMKIVNRLVEEGTRDLVVNQFLDSAIGAGYTGTGWTKVNVTAATFAAPNKGVVLGQNGCYINTTGGSISITSTDSNFVVGYLVGKNFGSIQVKIDTNIVDTIDATIDALQTTGDLFSTQIYYPAVKVYTCAGGTHTLKLTAIGTSPINQWPIDYIGHLKAPALCSYGIAIGEIPYYPSQGFKLLTGYNGGTKNRADQANNRIQRVLNEFRQFPVTFVPVTKYFNLSTGILSSDGRHPNSVGNAMIANAFLNSVVYHPIWNTRIPGIINLVDITADTSTKRLAVDANGKIYAVLNTLASPIINNQSGTTYTLQSSDNNKVVSFSNSSSITVTVNSGLGTGFNCVIQQAGTGNISFTGTATLSNAHSYTKSFGQGSQISIVPTPIANTYYLQGDMQP